MIRNLLPYLRYLHGNEVNKYFTQECVEANDGILWDDVNKCVISTVESNLKDDDEDDANFIGLDLAVKYKEAAQTTSLSPAPTSTNPTSSRPDPTQTTITHHKVVDAPLPTATTGLEYYRQDDDLSSIGMSATQTLTGSTTTNSSPSRPALGSFPQTIQATDKPAVVSNASLAPSAVFHPVAIPRDEQTTASSVTMESMMQLMEKRHAKQDQLLETMMQMMTTFAHQSNQSPPLTQSPSLGKANVNS